MELLLVGVLAHDVGAARRVGLGDQHQLATGMVGFVGVDELTPVTPRRMALRSISEVRVHRAQLRTRGALLQLVVGEPWRLADHRHGIGAEPFDAAVEPEPEHPIEVIDDIGVVPVEVGLRRREHREVPLTR